MRFLTYAHAYIRKNIMAAIKDLAYNQVFIPRRTLDLRRSVQVATSILRSQHQRPPGGDDDNGSSAEPSDAAVAAHLGVAESAVAAVREAFSTWMSSLDPVEGSGDCGSEDVQIMRTLDRISRSGLEASGSGSGALPMSPEAAGSSSGRGESEVSDGARFAAEEVASLGLDTFLHEIMAEKEAWVLKKTMGLGR